MAAKNRKSTRRVSRKFPAVAKSVFAKLWQGIVFVWKHPIILSVILLGLAVFLAYMLVTKSFVKYWNCHYLLVMKNGLPNFFCDGFDIPLLFTSIHVPALSAIMDKPLEFARKVTVWTLVAVFAFVSLYLTIIVNNFKAVIRILVLNKEEWKRFMASLRTWLLFFVSFCLIFFYIYFKVAKLN